MKKINIIKKNEDYNRIIQKYKPFKYNDYIFYIEWVDSTCYHFGFSVGKKIGNAVIRNKVKRQLKSILDKSALTFLNNSSETDCTCLIVLE